MKVLTFNLRNYTDDHWDERLPYIAQVLTDLEPDAAAFQEVRGQNDDPCCRNMAQQVQALCSGYPSLVTIPAMCYASQAVWEGLSILSKTAPADWLYQQLTWRKDDIDQNRRVMIWAKYVVDGRPLWLSNNHFAVPDDAAQQKRNVTEVLAALDSIVGGPALLVGDLNATQESVVWSKIDEAGWTDLWEEIHDGDAGGTYPTERTAKDAPLDKRIDYQWANAAFMNAATGTTIERVFTEKDPKTGLFASDHLGVLTEFAF